MNFGFIIEAIMQRKRERVMPKLTINIAGSEKKESELDTEEDHIFVKPIYSMKNTKKPPTHFVFDQEHLDQAIKERKQRRLEKEKELLLSSLDALKGGAISAIAEKQQQIQQLRSQLQFEQTKDMEDEIEELLVQKQDLKSQLQQLEEKLMNERQSFMRLLQEKDKVIEELYNELESSNLEIQKLQKYEEIKEKKIKIIQEENNSLFQQLETQKIMHVTQSHEYLKTDEQQNERWEQKQTSHQQYDNSHAKIQWIVDTEKIAQLEQRHKQQIKQLTAFYEKRMFQMRQIYEKELQLWPIDNKSGGSIQNQLMEDVPSLKETNVVVPHQLSQDLFNMKMLSDCYSVTKKHLSKIDSQSVGTMEKDGFDSNFKFLRRVNNTPQSQTTSSLKPPQQQFHVMVTQPKRTAIATDKKQQVKEGKQKQKWGISSFLVGALAGGSVALLLNTLIRR